MPLLSRGQEGRREKETVMDRSVRSRRDVLCACHCCQAVESCVITMPLLSRGQEGRREEGGGDGCVGAMAWHVVHALSPLLCHCCRTVVSCVVTVPLLLRRQES